MEIGGSVYQQSRHLNDDQLMPPDSICPFCGSEDRQFVSILQEGPEVSLLKCVNCNAVSASRIPTTKTLITYYQDYYTSNYSETNIERVTFEGTQRFGWHLARRVIDYLDKTSISILDFGGGDGSVTVSMAEKLLKKGFQKIDITIVDYNTTLVVTNDQRISLTHRDKLDNLTPNYDFVIASAIVEHLPQPKAILIRLLDLLSKGGIFYARTPYVVPFIKLLHPIGIKWDFTFPGHIHDLGQDFWESFFNKIFSKVDFSMLESRPSIVERSFKDHFLTTCAAYIFKLPWYLLGRRYTLVGGWEVFVRKNSVRIIVADT